MNPTNKSASTAKKTDIRSGSEDRRLAYISTFVSFKEKLTEDIMINIVTVAVATVAVAIFPSLIKTLTGDTTALPAPLVHLLSTVVLLYVSLSRIGFTLWDATAITMVLARLRYVKLRRLPRSKRDENLSELLKEENRLVRRLASLGSLSIISTLMPSLPSFTEILSSSKVPSFLAKNPLLLTLPFSLLFVFLMLYQLPPLLEIKNDLEAYYEEIRGTKIGATLSNKCPACGKRIPARAIYCLHCGFKITEEKE